jgi:hypothetical protein
MRRLPVGALLAALWISGPAAAQAPAKDELFGQIDGIVAQLADISGLHPLARVRSAHLSRDQMKQFLEQRIRESVKPQEIQAEEAVLKKFGFAPPEFDLKKTTVDLLAEQAAAFYDFHKKKLFVIDTQDGLDERTALVHELAHALADQHFHLAKFVGGASQNDDSALARLAVMEGQATWLMSEYVARQSGRSLKDSPELVKAMSDMNGASSGQFPVFDKSPRYLQETLLFPYSQGMLFQQAVVEKLGKAAFSEVFRRPPETTQEILHPALYLDRKEHGKRVRPALPAFQAQRHYRGFTDGEMGELDNSILLRQYAGDKQAAAIAPEWRGGYFRLFEPKHHQPDWRQMVLVYASEWSSPTQARAYFEVYQKVLAGKWKTFEVTSHSADAVAGRGDDGYFLLRLDGARVTSLEGLPEAELPHSPLSARTGSIEAARRAGTYAAPSATAVSTTTAAAISHGSLGFTP